MILLVVTVFLQCISLDSLQGFPTSDPIYASLLVPDCVKISYVRINVCSTQTLCCLGAVHATDSPAAIEAATNTQQSVLSAQPTDHSINEGCHRLLLLLCLYSGGATQGQGWAVAPVEIILAPVLPR